MNAPEEVRSDARQKTWQTLAARAALAGLQAWRSDAADGPQRFFVARFGLVRCCADLTELERVVELAGAPG